MFNLRGDPFERVQHIHSGVPNLVCTFGYIDASWTLRADLTSEYVCRLLDHLDETGARQVTPRPRRGSIHRTMRGTRR